MKHEVKGLLVDCGGTTYVVNDQSKFIRFDDFNPADHNIELATINNVAMGKGDASIMLVDSNGNAQKAIHKDALYIPSFKQDIFSVQVAADKGAFVQFKSNSAESGKVGSNVEQNREMEHHNDLFKEECRHFRGKVSVSSVNRVSHAAQPLEEILMKCDKASKVKSHRSKHTKKDRKDDVTNLAANFHTNEVFKCKPPRSHYAFPSCPINPLTQLNLIDFQDWLRDKVKNIIQRDV
ncbi:hypothetical protein HOLleu_10139 [Holothuria leucospilota]|uniref:Retrovirus-related Pol polyprotein from transposon TNT 1-94-like beta-barrel domain-containing protein n=1 Tax=Holothuria leucospilota TaxID=206669 RepID=A0A9Q1CD59_HOLLE|nr:hypothetical protein HOLleu_10139 [Holothuria leucospilota]